MTYKKFFKNGANTGLFIGAIVGLIASLGSSIELYHTLKNPDYNALCSINPVINCGSVMNSSQGAVLGFPNSFLGIFGFSAILAIMATIYFGAKLPSSFWRIFKYGALGNFMFVLWLMYESLFDIKTLCLYCIATWIASPLVALYGLLQYIRSTKFKKDTWRSKLAYIIDKRHVDIILGWYLIVFLVVLYQFWYYWQTLL
jgi:uncharacterized membrane protein